MKKMKMYLLLSANTEDIALGFNKRAFSLSIPSSGAGIANNRATILELVVFEIENVDTVLVEEIAVVLGDTDALGSLESIK